MFYVQLLTAKKGPLAKVWLAAHWDRKLTKANVFECNLESTVRDIISPQMGVGLRTSSHLLVGVVRIYFRKTKYLLADCSDALVKIRIAFRPDQTDLAEEGREATVKAITLMEDFTAFDTPLPDLSTLDAMDHFSLNQSRSEEITLREDLGSQFMDLVDFGDESHIGQPGLIDMSVESLSYYDGFGDGDKGYDLNDFLALPSDPATLLILNPPESENSKGSASDSQNDDGMEVETRVANETPTLPDPNCKTFALEPALTTPNSCPRRGKRKRKLFVDQKKELSKDAIAQQLADFSDLMAPMDLAPPTEQLMLWKESGGADRLLSQPCSTVLAPQMNALFSEIISQMSTATTCGEEEEEVTAMRSRGVEEGQGDVSNSASGGCSPMNSLSEHETTHVSELLTVDQIIDSVLENVTKSAADENSSEETNSELASEDSMLGHQSSRAQDSQLSTSLPTQHSALDSNILEDRRLIRRAQQLLNSLQSQTTSTFSLADLCKGATRSQAASTFYCVLVLKKRDALHLQQRAPFHDIIARPGPAFRDHLTA